MSKDQSLLYEGKAKKIFSTKEEDQVLVEFKDTLTAFNGKKKSSFKKKSFYNKNISYLAFLFLDSRGFKTHLLEDGGENKLLCQSLRIINLEVVVRNTLAGSICKRLGLKIGEKLKDPLVEYYYKNDQFEDPIINEDHVFILSLLEKRSHLEKIKRMALDINRNLKDFFLLADLNLVDFKLEFGWNEKDQIILADEISPDTCRLWDEKSGKILDKDRFRNDLGEVVESYKEVWERLEFQWRNLL